MLKPVNELIKKFPAIYQFCNDDLNKFVLLLRKGVYPYEEMDSWERFDESTIPLKENFYSKLKLKNITEKVYAHVPKVWGKFEIKNGGHITIYMFSVIHYCLQMCRKSVLEYMNLIPYILCQHQD